MNRNLDGIYMRVKRGEKYEAVCLSDMSLSELESVLNPKHGEWLKGAVMHLACTLRKVGDEFDIMGVTDDADDVDVG